MTIEPELVALLAVAASVLSLVLVGVVVVQGLRLRRFHRTQRRVFGRSELDIVEVLDRQAGAVAELDAELARARAEVQTVADALTRSVSRVAVVRYDAFEDMGGALSFSAALLDEHGGGLVISAINGRSETRSYAKPIVGGTSDYSLSSEETEAVAAALEGRPVGEPRGRPRRRRAS